MSVILAAVWLFAFRIADIMTVFKTYSSVWFPPSGVTLAMVLALPGWLRLVPLVANLSLALPAIRALVGVDVAYDFEPLVHGIRIYLIYGGAALFLLHIVKISMPFRSWGDVQWFLGTSLVAAALATASGVGMHILAGNMTQSEGFAIADTWWLGDALGAVMVPPMLVPALLILTGRSQDRWHWPNLRTFLMQASVIGLAALIGASGPLLGANLWYLVIPPALIIALRGGFEEAASAVLITCLLTPAVAMIFGAAGNVAALSPPLLVMSAAALLVGAATTERQETAERLEALVAQRTGELERAYEVQRHLVRSLGHDLRQPVEAINLTLSGLRLTQDPTALTAALERLRQLGLLASDFLTRILTYARLDTGDVRPQLQSFPLTALVADLTALYGPQAARKGQVLTWPDSDPTVTSDRELLFQILSNYLDNAIRLTPEGGHIRVEAEMLETGLGLFVIDSVDPMADHSSSRGGLGLRIVASAAKLLDARVVEEPNRRGIVLPPKR